MSDFVTRVADRLNSSGIDLDTPGYSFKRKHVAVYRAAGRFPIPSSTVARDLADEGQTIEEGHNQ